VHPVHAQERKNALGEGGGEVITLLEGGEEGVTSAYLLTYYGVLVSW
jgi:hypothetical protein